MSDVLGNGTAETNQCSLSKILSRACLSMNNFIWTEAVQTFYVFILSSVNITFQKQRICAANIRSELQRGRVIIDEYFKDIEFVPRKFQWTVTRTFTHFSGLTRIMSRRMFVEDVMRKYFVIPNESHFENIFFGGGHIN